VVVTDARSFLAICSGFLLVLLRGYWEVPYGVLVLDLHLRYLSAGTRGLDAPGWSIYEDSIRLYYFPPIPSASVVFDLGFSFTKSHLQS
jgi:hypothetical protein